MLKDLSKSVGALAVMDGDYFFFVILLLFLFSQKHVFNFAD
jgi:hypothetical protein